MSAHEDGINAGCAKHPMYMQPSVFEDMMRAYLEASGQVLVPREPPPEIHKVWIPMYRSLVATIDAISQPHPADEGSET